MSYTPVFNSKHHRAIAKAISSVNGFDSVLVRDRIWTKDLVDELSKVFLEDNGTFDKERFEGACFGALSKGRW